MTRLLQHRQSVLEDAYGFDPNGLVLVWLEPWDGQTSLPLSMLDPVYVEICRRIRLKGLDTVSHMLKRFLATPTVLQRKN